MTTGVAQRRCRETMHRTATLPLPLTQLALRCPPDIDDAVQRWGANCGPTALAACLSLTMAEVRGAVSDPDREPRFRGYMNTPQMRQALAKLGATVVSTWSRPRADVLEQPGASFLVKIQWDGPWSSHPRSAAAFAHWIAYKRGFVGARHYFARSHAEGQDPAWVFDGNIDGGWAPMWWWEREVVPSSLAAGPASGRSRGRARSRDLPDERDRATHVSMARRPPRRHPRRTAVIFTIEIDELDSELWRVRSSDFGGRPGWSLGPRAPERLTLAAVAVELLRAREIEQRRQGNRWPSVDWKALTNALPDPEGQWDDTKKTGRSVLDAGRIIR